MNSRLLKFILGGIAVVSLTAAAQKAPNCVASLAALEQRVELQRQLLWDWAGLIHYGSANTELPKPKPAETRVIFLGDEITENWPAEKFFPGKPAARIRSMNAVLFPDRRHAVNLDGRKSSGPQPGQPAPPAVMVGRPLRRPETRWTGI